MAVAYILPESLNRITQALCGKNIRNVFVTNALGYGWQVGCQDACRGVDFEVNLLKKVRVEIAVNAQFVQSTINAIVEGAGTVSIGDGRIFLLCLERRVRICA